MAHRMPLQSRCGLHFQFIQKIISVKKSQIVIHMFVTAHHKKVQDIIINIINFKRTVNAQSSQ
jgi:hypothetical protein